MNNFIISGLTQAPKDKKALAVQLAYCFFASIIILTVISSVVSSAYVSKLERERADAMMLVASSSAVVISGVPIELGMDYPVEIYTYDGQNAYLVNLYVHAHSSFIRVYSSYQDEQSSNPDMPVTLEGAGEEYIKAYQLEKIGLVSRVENGHKYYAAVAPILTSVGGVSGIVEIMVPEDSFSSTVNGFSLSWIFTILSISVSFTLVYYQFHRIFDTAYQKPDRRVPKIIRYGLNGCKLIAFFSAMGCVMLPVIMSTFVYQKMSAAGFTNSVIYLVALLCLVIYSMGFFGFKSFRAFVFKKFTSRLSTSISSIILFALLIVIGVFANVFVLLILALPTSFFYGMLFYFQREYRLYAGRLGHDGFEEESISQAQFSSQVYGAIVGVVVAGILFERFGILSVLLSSGSLLLFVSILTLLFVQHCPSSKEPNLTFVRYMYALTNRNSGSYLLSSVVTSGVQLAFYIGFVPTFLKNVGISLVTVSFYYILFAVCCCLLLRTVDISRSRNMSVKTRLFASSIIQIIGFLLLAIFPSAKVLVVTSCLMGLSFAIRGSGQFDYYLRMIREDKKQYAKLIFERAFATGVIAGMVVFGIIIFFSNNIRIPLLIFAAVFAMVSFLYLIVTMSQPQDKRIRNQKEESGFHNHNINLDDESNDDVLQSSSSSLGIDNPFQPFEPDDQLNAYNDDFMDQSSYSMPSQDDRRDEI